MNPALTAVPALILLGAVALPALVYVLLGTGESILSRLGPRP